MAKASCLWSIGLARGAARDCTRSPLKALAVDVAQNLTTPISEMKLRVTCETRTGDTPVSRRHRQRHRPPDILMTTPEQLAQMLSHDDAPHLFADLDTAIFDELHALAASKRP